MDRRNLVVRNDIPPDVLRQRRDLYAFALGLLLFNLAGGAFGDSGSAAVLVPIKFGDPKVLHAAAWCGLFYFWFRFWLISNVKPMDAFFYDMRTHAGDSRLIRQIAAAKAVPTTGNVDPGALEESIRKPGGFIPKVGITSTGRPYLEMMYLSMRYAAEGASGHIGGTIQAHPESGPIELSRREQWAVWFSLLRAIPRAMVMERTFTDYVLPHHIALFSVLVAVLRWYLSGEPTPSAS